MIRPLVLRPQPGADASAARLRAMGFDPVVAPLFMLAPVEWALPEAPVAAVLMTSASAARLAGPQLGALVHLPLYAVGAATAEAARTAGFRDIVTGPGDAAALAPLVAHAPVLHLAGVAHRADALPAGLVRRIVYADTPVAALPGAVAEAARDGAVALLHSPRAAARFAALAGPAGVDRRRIALAAISAAAAEAAGGSWADVAVAAQPREAALLAVAARLCDQGRGTLGESWGGEDGHGGGV